MNEEDGHRRLADLRADPANPRVLQPENQRRLAESMSAFGDLSGLVYNRQLDLMVGGHQRKGQLSPDARVVVTERYAEPNEVGTVAVGYVEGPDGERWSYREVEWDADKHRLANVAANNRAMQGEFHFPTLADIVADLEGRGIDVAPAGYDRGEIERMLNWTPDEDMTNLETTMVKDPASTIGTYLTNTIKQIILYFGNDEYGSVVDRLDAIAEAEGFANNTAVVMHLLEHYERTEGIP